MSSTYESLTAPQADAFIITPSDATFQPANAIYVGVAGDVSVVTEGGTTVTFTNVPVGILPIRVQQVRLTGTTASELVGLRN